MARAYIRVISLEVTSLFTIFRYCDCVLCSKWSWSNGYSHHSECVCIVWVGTENQLCPTTNSSLVSLTLALIVYSRIIPFWASKGGGSQYKKTVLEPCTVAVRFWGAAVGTGNVSFCINLNWIIMHICMYIHLHSY